MASFPNATRADRQVYRMRVDNLMRKRSPNRVSAGPMGAQAWSASQGTTALLFTVDFQDSRFGSSVKWGVWNLSSWICLKHSLICSSVAVPACTRPWIQPPKAKVCLKMKIWQDLERWKWEASVSRVTGQGCWVGRIYSKDLMVGAFHNDKVSEWNWLARSACCGDSSVYLKRCL